MLRRLLPEERRLAVSYPYQAKLDGFVKPQLIVTRQASLYRGNMKVDGTRIRAARLKRGLSQRKLADALGVSVQAVSLWETNKSEPGFARTNHIANVLEVNYKWLYGEIDLPNSDKVQSYIDSGSIPIVDASMASLFDKFVASAKDRFFKSNISVVPSVKMVGRGFGVIYKDDDMEPTVNNGDLLIFDPGVLPNIGDIVIAAPYESPLKTFVRELTSHEVLPGMTWPTTQFKSHKTGDLDFTFGTEKRLPAMIIAPLVETRRFRAGAALVFDEGELWPSSIT